MSTENQPIDNAAADARTIPAVGDGQNAQNNAPRPPKSLAEIDMPPETRKSVFYLRLLTVVLPCCATRVASI